MWLQRLVLTHFRNYECEEIDFTPGLNCIQGKNAEGKTNILEAIYLMSTGKSFRTHHLQDLIHSSSKGFRVEAVFSKEGISQSLKLSFDGQNRKILYNQTTYTSFLPLFGILPCILLAPEDISILSGSPSQRRRFIDLHLAQLDPLYVYHLGRYYKAMRQRNFLLKKQDEKGLSPWEQIMAQSSVYLIEKRRSTITCLQSFCEKLVFLLSESKDRFHMQYQSSLQVPLEDHKNQMAFYLEQWQKSRKRDLLLGSTLSGPHRDDILFQMNDKEVQSYCSEGQKRSCIAALRLAEWELFRQHLESPPLLGIDDFGIHLDTERTRVLAQYVSQLGQVILTAPSFSKEHAAFSQASFLEVCNAEVKIDRMTDAENRLVLEESL
jgi:DNA replication and repair protein RecF